jgi:hypothetical protein
MAVRRVTGINVRPAKHQHFRGYASRRNRSQDAQGLIESREDQAQAAKQLKDTHRQPNSMGNRIQGRHSLLGIGKLPHRAPLSEEFPFLD